MQVTRRVDVPKPGSPERTRLGNPDRVELALEIAAPEFQKTAQLGKVGGDIELLPDEALQQGGMIRHVIDDLCGRQSIIAQRLLVVAHFTALVLFARSERPACRIDRSVTIKK